MRESLWCLWLDGERVYGISQLRTFFDAASLCGYFLGGSLIRWLRAINENELADKVNELDIHGDIAGQLAVIFGVKEPELPGFSASEPAAAVLPVSSSFSFGDFSSFSPDSGSFAVDSGFAPQIGSFEMTSGFAAFENSFSYGSFGLFSSFAPEFAGSFDVTSFSTSGFSHGNGEAGCFSYTKEQNAVEMERKTEETPQQKLIRNIQSSPLNRYGYGIHLI